MHVGRLAPNKCIEDIIKIFFFINNKLKVPSKLWLVGIDTDTELYSFSLKRMTRELGISDAVRFVGCFADSEVKALYQHADCYLCMSEHEGFCLPVVEAMHFGVPVIAYQATALPETLKNGGILVSEKRHAEIAELILELKNNQKLKSEVVERGCQRVKELDAEVFFSRIAELFPQQPLGRAIGNYANRT
jgi:glycosyltransferase involved in cell wall biosynthesis